MDNLLSMLLKITAILTLLIISLVAIRWSNMEFELQEYRVMDGEWHKHEMQDHVHEDDTMSDENGNSIEFDLEPEEIEMKTM